MRSRSPYVLHKKLNCERDFVLVGTNIEGGDSFTWGTIMRKGEVGRTGVREGRAIIKTKERKLFSIKDTGGTKV